MYVAFNKAISKLENSLKKYKSKFKNHHAGKVKIHAGKIKTSEIAYKGTKYTINLRSDSEISNAEDNDNPAIIAERPIEILKFSVKEAVMKMGLEDLPAVEFKSITNDRINIVYYRKDGNISWGDYN